MNLLQMKELESSREYLEKREQFSSVLYEKNVIPLLEEFEDDFMDKITTYFEENGFDVKKSVQGSDITAEYKKLLIDVTRTSRSINIKEGNAVKAIINIRNLSYAGGSMSIPADEFLAEKARIQHQLNGVDNNIEHYSNPEVYYEFTGKRYSNPNELILEIYK
ncbi:hypothetical protein MKZ26_03300 [Sporosarcina sp. FSL K6-6792]|uniref:hypothetical protein n=1 Tax=Sporosarcina sp. FSL K6-6792 TaxID=2921559 RepID=UPI0030F4BFE5